MLRGSRKADRAAEETEIGGTVYGQTSENRIPSGHKYLPSKLKGGYRQYQDYLTKANRGFTQANINIMRNCEHRRRMNDIISSGISKLKSYFLNLEENSIGKLTPSKMDHIIREDEFLAMFLSRNLGTIQSGSALFNNADVNDDLMITEEIDTPLIMHFFDRDGM
ncbi:hypothetical protein CHS0354_005630 [Potamilus streckersoni]|uniref:Uncharacterized protein n=1 Tax=Potamilus streckersoni TaxID=2493646 RepID=A0AAE0SAF7_9BIVA|nr:hypothetical protein CHS0354_005630 [Potamilus streckersoni]